VVAHPADMGKGRWESCVNQELCRNGKLVHGLGFIVGRGTNYLFYL
jgi:hypothetical protein